MNDAVESAVREALADFLGRTVAIGVSGGADSVALATAFAQIAKRSPRLIRGVVFHFDHGWRADSGADRDFVQALAERHGMPFVTARGSGRPAHGSAEAAARNERHSFFQAAAAAHGVAAIALAHHADDVREQTAIALLRKSGPRGLAGIRPYRVLDRYGPVAIVRPFLALPRQALHRYLRARGIAWREDGTNADLSFLRNRIRLGVLADATTADAAFHARLETLRREAAIIDERTERFIDRFMASFAVIGGDRSTTIERARWRALPPNLAFAVLRRAEETARGRPSDRAGAAFTGIRESIARRPAANRTFPLGDGVALFEHGAFIVVRPNTARRPPPHTVVLEIPGQAVFDDRFIVSAVESSTAHATFDENAQTAPSAAITGPLEIRTAEVGERFVPFGMTGRKLVSDLYQEARIPVEGRARRLVIADGSGILWIPGVRAAERCRVRSEDRVIRMSVHPAPIR